MSDEQGSDIATCSGATIREETLHSRYQEFYGYNYGPAHPRLPKDEFDVDEMYPWAKRPDSVTKSRGNVHSNIGLQFFLEDIGALDDEERAMNLSFWIALQWTPAVAPETVSSLSCWQELETYPKRASSILASPNSPLLTYHSQRARPLLEKSISR
ncbi:hypothetical protein BT69DRAFT_401264 [Atractiella rhizophila]|nr:hypothetical protein BT69DRAFT_401264 [Atractiella rhizophila]